MNEQVLMQHPPYPTIEDTVGRTPLVALQRIGAQDSAARAM